MPYKFLLLLLICSFGMQAQKHILWTGTVTDSLNNNLENAYVIAIPKSLKENMKFSITDHRGRYSLELLTEEAYTLSVSYLGYETDTLYVPKNKEFLTYDFVFNTQENLLNEVVISYNYEPIVVKKDTLVYDMAAFVSGQERKMEDILKKLPGVEVDKNGVIKVQGKNVTQLLVENRSFFGGGSKLAVENIPADAIDKIEVIDNFNEVGFLKEVSNSEDLAMNVKLKEDKKNFLFGDLEVAGGNQKHYLLHAALFYYTPDGDISAIGDVNSIGKSVFTYADIIRFEGGISRLINNKQNLTNLKDYMGDNQEVEKNLTRFSAVNFSKEITGKIRLCGFGIFSNNFLQNRSATHNTYFTETQIIEEEKQDLLKTKNLIGLLNFKLDYEISKNERLHYNAHIETSNADIDQWIDSYYQTENRLFQSQKDADNFSFKQYVEWHKSYNKNHITSAVVQYGFDRGKPKTNWKTN